MLVEQLVNDNPHFPEPIRSHMPVQKPENLGRTYFLSSTHLPIRFMLQVRRDYLHKQIDPEQRRQVSIRSERRFC
jgi:hypothetical protein